MEWVAYLLSFLSTINFDSYWNLYATIHLEVSLSLSPYRAHSPMKEMDKQQLKYCVITVTAEICASIIKAHTQKGDWGVRGHFPCEMITERAM